MKKEKRNTSENEWKETMLKGIEYIEFIIIMMVCWEKKEKKKIFGPDRKKK